MNLEHASHEALFFEGTRHMAAGDAPGAEACFRAALRIAPDCAEAHANLGLVLEKTGATGESEACYRRSIALNWSYAETHLNLGAFLAKHKRFDEAEASYDRAILLNPRSPVAWSNLGVLYACMKREEDAERCFRTAMHLDGNYGTARFNLSYVQLRQGRYAEGWRSLEARNWNAALAARLAVPRWQGESLSGKSLLIGYEAGHGDMIQFCRYAGVLKARGASRIALVCHPALKTLFATLGGVDTVIAFDEHLPGSGWDFWTPPLSIPYYCNTCIETIPAAIPYLHALPHRVAKWSASIPSDGIRVGLVWKGSVQFENDADRSIPRLDLLAPLGAVAGVRFVSLQKGAGEDEAAQPPAGLALVHLGSQIEDFADSAAIVASLDLVICVDTAIAHLAGALGKPCWVMLPYYKTDWRWLTGRTDSPWYPESLRLFHQPDMGNWLAVIAEVRTALEQFVEDWRAKRAPAAQAPGKSSERVRWARTDSRCTTSF
jgi:Flp pilus assembly protein TadD